MTVTASYTPAVYQGNGTATVFPFPFRIFADTDLVVTRTEGTASATLTLGSGYTINGQNVVLPSTLASGQTLVIERALPVVQETSFLNQGAFFPEAHENALDRATMEIQQVGYEVSRSLRLPPQVTTPDTELPIPEPGYCLGWNLEGDGLVNIPSPGAQSWADLASSTTGKGDALIATKQPFTGAVARTQHDKNAERVSIVDLGAVSGGVEDNSSALSTILALGIKELFVPDGVFALNTAVSATLTNNLRLYGPGVFKYTGIQNTSNIITVETNGYDITVDGIEFDGNSLCCGGPKIQNNTDTFSKCTLKDCHIHDFYMGTAAIWNSGFIIRGSFELVIISGNRIKNIKRASGTGTPGSSGTNGGYTMAASDSVTRFPKKVIHENNKYENIFGGDLVGSTNNVDYDGFAYFSPDATNFPNSDSANYCQPNATLTSRGNKYINCRGRAIKAQGLAFIEDETIERNADYTIYGASIEINLQWGTGTIRNCQFIYRDYLVGATVTSPIQTGLILTSIYQGSDYSIANAGASVSGLRVYNSIKTGVGSDISYILQAMFGSTPLTQRKPLINLSDVAIDRGTIDFIVATNLGAGGYCLMNLKDIVVDKIAYAAIGLDGAGANCEIIANGVFHMDGIVTPANKKYWFKNVTTHADAPWSGRLTGFGNRGFVENYAYGSTYQVHPMLDGAAISARSGAYGSSASAQCLYLADDASASFEARGFTANAGIFNLATNGQYTEQGLIASNGAALYVIAAHAAHAIAASTTGTNPDVDGKINIWIEAGVIKVANRSGAARLVSILFFG